MIICLTTQKKALKGIVPRTFCTKKKPFGYRVVHHFETVFATVLFLVKDTKKKCLVLLSNLKRF